MQVVIHIVLLTLTVIFHFISMLNKLLFLFRFRAMEFVQDAGVSGKRKVVW